MSNTSLEQRVAALEERLAALVANGTSSVHQKDWRRTIGMFTGDEMMQQILVEGHKIRQADRRRARKRPSTGRRRKP